MKQTVLGQTPHEAGRQLKRQAVFYACLALATAGSNFLLTMLRTPANHTALLMSNIALDIGCSFFLLYRISEVFLPRYRLYRLSCRSATRITATVTHISPGTIRYMQLNCYEITADGGKCFLPADTICLEPDRQYTLGLVSNIIVEADL